MDKIKCYHENCGKNLTGKDYVWQVMVVHEDGNETYVPCCCQDCAYKVIHKYMAIHKARYSNVKRQLFQMIQRMTISQFGST